MKSTHRNYSDINSDFNLIANFILDNSASVRDHSTWCLGRFVDWKYSVGPHKQAKRDFWDQNAHLWFDGFGNLAGFVISEGGGPEITIITHKGYRLFFEEMLAWTLATWGERVGALNIEIPAVQSYEIGILERYGFRKESVFYSSEFDLTSDLLPVPDLPEGFSFSDLEETPDHLRLARLRADAFGGGESGLTEDALAARAARYDRDHKNPIYHARTNMVVLAPDGTFASGCEALMNPRSCEVDIERVCTHSDFRRRGLARAVILANMQRLKPMGYTRAYIAGYSDAAIALYASLGHIARREFLIYKLDA